jgi:pyruvate,water dikinase
MIVCTSASDKRIVGGKAWGLAQLGSAGFTVPAWTCIGADVTDAELDSSAALATILRELRGERFAVRSSGIDEDGSASSFAGQFETYLDVPRDEVLDRVRAVRASAGSARVREYRRLLGLPDDVRIAVVVQEMLAPTAAGVAFGRDPIDGGERVIVSAVEGLGERLVSGEASADTFRVATDGTIVERTIVQGAISDEQARRIAGLARLAERHFGAPQDLEWAIVGDAIHLLQSRPITALAGPSVLWDNANIAESYGGQVSPLTFSFARYAYAKAYRQMLAMLAVPSARIAAHDDALENMLGLVQGRMYYNLINWYRLLALLPGFRLNRRFMEQMMGVDEGLPAEIVAELERTGRGERLSELFVVARMVIALLVENARLSRRVREFHAWFEATMQAGKDPAACEGEELIEEFAAIERRLATRWDAPLLNDFFAMIAFGLLKSLCRRWCGDTSGTLQNDLLAGAGGMISAEPARLIAALGKLARQDPGLAQAMRDDDRATIESRMIAPLRPLLDEYLARFGDRCESELKLESIPLTVDPLPLYRAVGRAAESRLVPAHDAHARAAAERRVSACITDPVRRAIFARLLKATRDHLRDRENMRLERTRLFGRIRRIFLALGAKLVALDIIDEGRDVFWLTIDENFAAFRERKPVRELVAGRKNEQARNAGLPAPATRVQTRDGRIVSSPRVRGSSETERADATQRTGLGCCAGIVRGTVCRVTDPNQRFTAGAILVAERTDPSWVMLFPAASGILVERGSLLSHAAIVSREMGIPSVVAVPGLMSWLHDGDEVEFDGSTGAIHRLGPSAQPEALVS